jgi:hypothetical protein
MFLFCFSQIEEAAPFTAEMDDYHDEKDEIAKDQGPAFPYTKGLWLLSNLVAAINPDDLDALDENVPLTKFTLDDILGREHTEQEYSYYFHHNPHARLYADRYHSFLTERVSSRVLIPPSERIQRKKSKCVIM